jgi:glutaredoxin 3
MEIDLGTLPMTTIEIYTKPTCGFCHMAKRLLKSKGVSFAEVNISAQPERRAEMIQRANGGSTVPQIFIGDTHVGGCTELMALERQGKLDAMLAA